MIFSIRGLNLSQDCQFCGELKIHLNRLSIKQTFNLYSLEMLWAKGFGLAVKTVITHV